MKKHLTVLLTAILCFAKTSTSQPPAKQPDGGGDYRDMITIKDELTPQQRSAIITMLQANETRLRREGKLNSPLRTATTAFEWPLKQALGYNDNGFYAVSNYVDENTAYPNQVTDYNCGNRSYDLNNGYNHRGTDIYTWPFSWQKMSRNAVQVIAGAPGVIIGKTEGNYDQNCAFCVVACDWNAVYVRHDDGSVAWYGHLKSGAITTKIVGDSLITGEYLGIVGSSGNSTGPHLHFEVWANSTYTQLIDPWAGNCNLLNGNTSWWANQQPYWVPTLNKIMTQSAPPNLPNCPVGEASNEKINFADGQLLYMGSYYRDVQNSDQATHTLYLPNGTLYSTWVQNFNTTYTGSWWYYFITLPTPAATGNWRYEILYKGKRHSTWFAMNSTAVTICPNSISPIYSNLTGNTYQWQVNTGGSTDFINLSDNSSYGGTATNQLQLLNVPSSFYGYQYRCVVDGGSFSHTLTLKFVSYWLGKTSKNWEDPSNWTCGNIPDANTDVVIQNDVANFPEVNSNTSCRSVTVNTGATLTVKPGVNLNVMH